jgi:hypothetical protein
MLNSGSFGKTQYFADHEGTFGRLFIAVLCYVEEIDEPVIALLDTASEWCMMPSDIALSLGHDLGAGGDTRIHTRRGILTGRLEIVPLEFRADDLNAPGEQPVTLRVDATWFLSEDWPGPAVIGWKGCLERMRFGVDPGHDLFCFAELDGASESR